MEIVGQIASNIDLFLMVLARVSGIFIAAPVFSNRVMPGQARALMTMILSVIMFSSLQLTAPDIPVQIGPFALYMAGEIIIGLVIGFVAQFVFSAVQFAGQNIDFMMGYSIVNVVDPLNGTQASLIGSFKNIISLLVFLATNSHHYVIVALYKSYDKIPIFGLAVPPEATNFMIDLFGTMLVTGLKLAMPVIGAIFVTEVALGMVARMMPQMPVFFVGIPAKIFIGAIMITIILPVYIIALELLFEGNYQDTLRMLQILGKEV